jgi:hypothetical protein
VLFCHKRETIIEFCVLKEYYEWMSAYTDFPIILGYDKKKINNRLFAWEIFYSISILWQNWLNLEKIQIKLKERK